MIKKSIENSNRKVIDNNLILNELIQSLGHIAIVVDDCDNAIDFYTKKFHFDLIEDLVLSETKRWILVRTKGSNGCSGIEADYLKLPITRISELGW